MKISTSRKLLELRVGKILSNYGLNKHDVKEDL